MQLSINKSHHIIYKAILTLDFFIMRNINLYFKLCLVLVFLFMVACSDENRMHNFPGGTSARLLPVKVSGEKNGGQTILIYDNYNRLVNCSYYLKSGGGLSKYSELKIEYDTDGCIKKAIEQTSGGENNTYLFTYDESQIVIQDTYYTRYIDADAQGRILGMKQSYNNDRNTSVVYNYSYDQKGNITKYDLNNNYYSYVYDNYNGIYSYVNTPQWFLVIMLGKSNFVYNNCTEIYTYSLDENGKEQAPVTFKLTYTYNDNGYPVKYHIPNMSFCGTPPLPESDFNIEYQEAKDVK